MLFPQCRRLLRVIEGNPKEQLSSVGSLFEAVQYMGTYARQSKYNGKTYLHQIVAMSALCLWF